MEPNKRLSPSALSSILVRQRPHNHFIINLAIVAIVLLCQCILARSDAVSEKAYKTGIPTEDNEISIVISKTQTKETGSNKAHEDVQRNVRVNEDEGGQESNGNSTVRSESTTFDKCGPGSKCCYQYTWPGYQDYDTIPAATNATCEFLRKAKKLDDTSACFDPPVYTSAIEDNGNRALGTPPNFTLLKLYAEANNWNIYCPMTDKNCVTYTFYSRDGSKRMTNQTNFCGVVTNTNTGNRITNGCYRQNVGGYIREVCVCSRSLCNGVSSVLSIPGRILVTLAIFSFTLGL